MKKNKIMTQIAACGLMALLADGAVFRYNGSGSWNDISNGPGDPTGWGENPNNPPANPGSLPGDGDTARINFGGNTVTVDSAVPSTRIVQIGVDENGNLEIASGGSLTTTGHTFVGNNNPNVTSASLTVLNGGSMNVNGILWSSNNGATGNIFVESGGILTVGDHLWLGVSQPSTISIGGTLTQTGGILGLGTNNASTASGGTATVNILNGGLLALNNISGTGTNSIQAGSVIDIQGSGQLTIPGDFQGIINNYIAQNRITGDAALNVVFDVGSNLTTVSTIPEPSPALLLGLAGALGIFRRRK